MNGPEYGPLNGGYNFTSTWKSVLPRVNYAALALYNFKTGSNAILGYRTTRYNWNRTSGTVNLKLIGSRSKMIYLAFSILIMTEDNPDIYFGSKMEQNKRANIR